LVELSRLLREGEKIKIGGLKLKILKKLNGLRFTFPWALIDVTKAIGRGATEEINS